MMAEQEFTQHGRKIGGVVYLNHPEDALARIEARINSGIPLPHEDDETLESNFLFRCLTESQQARVKATQDVLEKRRRITGFLAVA